MDKKVAPFFVYNFDFLFFAIFKINKYVFFEFRKEFEETFMSFWQAFIGFSIYVVISQQEPIIDFNYKTINIILRTLLDIDDYFNE